MDACLYEHWVPTPSLKNPAPAHPKKHSSMEVMLCLPMGDILGCLLTAIVLSVDEKTQVQALDRTGKSLPMKPGLPARMTHDYKRNGTTTLFTALNALAGAIIGRHAEHHRHKKFIELHNGTEAKVFNFTTNPERLIVAHQIGCQINRTKR